ncbi:MAG: helix-turn-helix domain-containing protein [Catenibacillus sp.]
MNNNLLLHKFLDIIHIPVTVYQNGKIHRHYNAKAPIPDVALTLMKPHLKLPHAICYLITPDYMLFGIVRDKKSRKLLIVGPASPYRLTVSQARHLLKFMRLSNYQMQDILRWFHHLPIYDIPSFRKILEYIHLVISGQKDNAVHVSYHPPADNPDKSFHSSHRLQNLYAAKDEPLTEMIKNGDCKALITQFKRTDFGIQTHASPDYGNGDSLRTAKDQFIIATSITSRIAIHSSVDYDTAASLSDYYIIQAEKLKDCTSINALLKAMLLDFTKRVARVRHQCTGFATVNAIYRDIDTHLYDKISGRDIALRLGLNSSYISHYFSEKTGMSLSEYIQKVKIDESTHLMKTTALSIAEIADMLSFSSQQYFQKVFKKHMGMTPKAYKLSLILSQF